MKHPALHRWLTAVAAVTLMTGIAAAPAAAETQPPGANDWSCKPSAAHPNPVVLVHGTGGTAALNWMTLSPMLAREGYCVFSFEYGATMISAGVFYGLGDIPTSARTMATFVDKVLETTGAAKVDVVGHSQGGGMLPNYYIKRLGGAAKVRTLVGMAPSNHGTTSHGLGNLVNALGLMGLTGNLYQFLQMPALTQQVIGSPVATELYADGDTVPGVRYVVIQTRKDLVITPYTQAFLNGDDVTNILLQDQCPDNPVGHIGLFLDSPTMQNILNALGPNTPDFKPTCTGYGPIL
ncbi:esterase/lipase family protein [Nocardia salmonicida]|uniref:esterase/lipase family protein n=1 Tax=Nocardia salmonicida TaxID=53431 RepID=UPI002E2B9F62|nr:alpha/beta fold hydrolase [Nocardia salmonicida]